MESAEKELIVLCQEAYEESVGNRESIHIKENRVQGDIVKRTIEMVKMIRDNQNIPSEVREQLTKALIENHNLDMKLLAINALRGRTAATIQGVIDYRNNECGISKKASEREW